MKPRRIRTVGRVRTLLWVFLLSTVFVVVPILLAIYFHSLQK